MNFKLYIFLFLIISGVGHVKSQNQKLIQQYDTIPLNPEVRYGKLDNGFTYYLLKNDNPENKIHMRLVVKAGRMHEDKDQLEYAHLLEHLVAGSTKHFPVVNDFISSVGGYKNANIGSRFTRYYAKIPADDRQGLKQGLQLLRDWAQGNKYQPDQIEVQRAAVEGEFRNSNPHRQWVGKKIEIETLKNLSYIIYDDKKHIDNLRNFNSKAFARFYKDWYRPDLEAAIIVGNINPDTIEAEIKQLFSDLKIPEKKKDANARVLNHTIKLIGENFFTTVNDSTSDELALNIIHTAPNFAQAPNSTKDYKNMLVQQLYNLMIEEKEDQLKQQFNPPFENFVTNHGVNQLPDWQLKGFLMNLNLDSDNIEQQKSEFQRGLIAWKRMQTGFDENELEAAKEILIQEYHDESHLNSSSLAKELEMHFLYGKAAPNPEIKVNIISTILADIDLNDIQDYLQRYENLGDNVHYIFFKGRGVNVPNEKVLKQWIQEVDTMSLKPIIEKKPLHSLADFVKIPISKEKKVIRETENMIGVTTIEMANGLKLILKPTKPRKKMFENQVSIQAFRPNSVPLENRREYLSAKIVPELVQYTGAGPFNKFELDRFKKEKGMELRFRTTTDNQMIYGETKLEELPEFFNLLYLYLDQPRKDQEGFEAWKAIKKEELEGKAIKGSENFITEKIEYVWYPELPHLKMEDLNTMNMDGLLQSFKKWNSGIEDFTLIVTGDFDKNEITPLLVNTLSAFPVVNDKNKIVTTKQNLKFPLQKMEHSLEYKNVNQVYTDIYFPVKVPKDLKTEIVLQLLNDALYKEVYKRLRNGCYSPKATGEWLDYKNGIFAFHIQFDSALGNEDRMREYAMEAFRAVKEKRFDGEWLKATASNELRAFERKFESFGYFNLWPDYLQSNLEKGKDPEFNILTTGTLLEHFIDSKDLNTAAKKYLIEDYKQVFLGYPEDYEIN
ncbi:M16 family metallopeptidase [Gramella jeungdoensis]|nr:insulinase family protein [Gramella jeungdoensis]